VIRRPSFIARQAGQPTGWVGRLLLRVMARETARFNREVLAALAAADADRILEIGYGHGRTLSEAAELAPRATFAGIDIAADAERSAARRCGALVVAGRLELRTGDAAELPWSPGAFTAAYAVHAIYFWPDPHAVLAEVRRVIAPDGRFVLGMRERTEAAVATFPGYRFYDRAEVTALVRDAGFAEVEVRDATSGPDLRIVIAQ
jgi:SAM-dependent methyltransferase